LDSKFCAAIYIKFGDNLRDKFSLEKNIIDAIISHLISVNDFYFIVLKKLKPMKFC